jgi:hypothetical protein
MSACVALACAIVLMAAAGLLIAVASLAGLILAAVRRRRERSAASGGTRIVGADYHRLVVTHSRAENAVYVLRPPGTDAEAVLRVARLVLPEERYAELETWLGLPAVGPEDPYEELADLFGVPGSWPI